MTINKKQLSTIKTILTDLETQLEKDVLESKKASQPVTLDQQAFGRVTRIDAIQQQQMQLAAVQRIRQRLAMVKAALARLDSEDFGFCSLCEEPIAIERLKVRPESPLCISCAKKS